jgi:hypothetical protein
LDAVAAAADDDDDGAAAAAAAAAVVAGRIAVNVTTICRDAGNEDVTTVVNCLLDGGSTPSIPSP